MLKCYSLKPKMESKTLIIFYLAIITVAAATNTKSDNHYSVWELAQIRIDQARQKAITVFTNSSSSSKENFQLENFENGTKYLNNLLSENTRNCNASSEIKLQLQNCYQTNQNALAKIWRNLRRGSARKFDEISRYERDLKKCKVYEAYCATQITAAVEKIDDGLVDYNQQLRNETLAQVKQIYEECNENVARNLLRERGSELCV